MRATCPAPSSFAATRCNPPLPGARNSRAAVDVAPAMTQGHTISTHAEDVHVEVRLDGELVADARRPVMLEETGLPTAYYLPKDALTVDARPIELSTHCPFKGDASYWTIEVGGRTHDAIAWSYETPTRAPRTSKATWRSSPTGPRSSSTASPSDPPPVRLT
jgi:uncharacterized protein (DUF427 family)